MRSTTRPRRVLAAVGLVAALGATGLDPAAAAAPDRAPTLTPATVTAGTATSVTGAPCRTGTGVGTVSVTLRDTTGQYRGGRSAVVDAAGSWTATLTPDAGLPAGGYTVVSTCTVEGVAATSRPATLQVTATTAAPWVPMTLPTPSLSAARINDVSCGSATFCVAVGSDPTTGIRPLVNTWDGTEWSAVTLPSDTPDGDLQGVSCASATRCVAVGSAADSRPLVVELLDGAWSARTPALPTGVTSGGLADVSCPSATACLAVGQDLAYRLARGSWEPVAPPTGVGLNAVSCPNPGSCTAVGRDTSTSVPVALTYRDSSWTPLGLATLPPGSNTLADVSCAGTSCTLVGSSVLDGAYRPLVLVATGTRVGRQRVDLAPPATDGGLTGVSCPGSGPCTAVGYAMTRDSSGPLLARPTAGAWSGVVVTRSEGISYDRVSCAAGTCMAVGSSPSGPVAAVQADGTSTDLTLAVPWQRAAGFLSAVACSAKDACTAVGTVTSAPLPSTLARPVAERWDGRTWTLQTLPRTTTGAQLTGVACPAADRCVAVGSVGGFFPDLDGPRPFVAVWQGSAWHAVDLPTPRRPASLTAVSCIAVDSCLAVGSAGFSGDGTPVAYALSGSTWTETPAPPLPAGAQRVTLTGVSCTDPTSCRVVGQAYLRDATPGVDLEWTGTAWLTGPGVPASLAVSCSSPSACVAPSLNIGHAPDTVASVWDGSTWTPQLLPDPSFVNSLVYGVSCPTAGSCVAVGGKSVFDGSYVVRQTSDGWVQQPTPAGGPGGLNGVACPTTDWCVAVGYGPGALMSPGG